MLSVDELWSRIEPRSGPRGRQTSARAEALGRRLAEPLRARDDLPAVDVSALDGFALAGDLPQGVELPVAGTVAAGDPPGAVLPPGSALRIWTGAPIPVGADRVVAIERTGAPARERVRLLEPTPAGHAIRRGGEVVRAGDELMPRGAVLTAAALALAASQGIDRLEVVRAPRVAILATGDEVVPPDETPRPGELRDSHTDFLRLAGRRLGAAVRSLGVAPDDPEELERRLGPALEAADVVVTCGGVSMGGADHLPRVFERLGCRIEAHGVAVQPGKPLLFAARGEALVFGLPGNPASVMVGFRLFVRPALERMLGDPDAAFWSEAIEVGTDEALRAGEGRDRFLPATRLGPPADFRARPIASRGSHDLAAFARANLLLRVRAPDGPRVAGDRVEAVAWD